MNKSIRKSRLTAVYAILMAVIMALSVILAAACGKSKISLDKTEHTMYVADVLRLNATAPEGEEITWETSDKKVATVLRGTVNAVAPGTATITASLESGASASCVVTVLDRSVTISQQTATIDLDSDNWTITLSATASDNGEVTWSSSDTSLATVSGGIVTATGYDIGEVTITAQRGAAKADCIVTIVQPSRPADFKYLESKTNADTIANAGQWFFFADSSGSVTYKQKPNYGGGALNVTFETAPNLAEQKYFSFRYQPVFSEDEVKGQDEHGRTLYAFTATITVSVDAAVRMGQPVYKYDAEGNKTEDKDYGGLKTSDFTAGVAKTVTYFFTLDDAEPFSIRVNALGAGVESLNGVTLKVENIEFRTRTADEVAPVDPPIAQNPGESYTMTYGDRATTTMHPGRWYYMIDSTGNGEGELIETPAYDNGTLTMKLSTLTEGKTYQLRTQPLFNAEDPLADIGQTYTVTFTVNLTAEATLLVGRDNKITTINEIPVGVDTELSVDCDVDATYPFYFQLKPADYSAAITMTIKNVVFTEREVDPGETPEVPGTNGDLEVNNNSGTIAAPGKWFYKMDSASDYSFETAPYYQDGTVGVTFENAPVIANGHYFYFLYQPTYGTGKAYTVTMTITLSVDADVRIGQPGIKADGSNDYGTFKTVSVKANTATEVTYEGVIGTAEPFSVRVNALGEGVDSLDGVTLTLTEISFTNASAAEPPVEEGSYDLTWGSKGDTTGNAGHWYYMIDTDGNGKNEVNEAKYEDGVITLDLSKTDASAAFQLRYQPEFETGTAYEVTFTVKVSAAAFIIVGRDGDTKNYPDGATSSDPESPRYEAEVEYTVTYTGTVDASNPFFIQLKAVDVDAPIVITISDIVFTPVN